MMRECCFYSCILKLSPISASATAMRETNIYPKPPIIEMSYNVDLKGKYPLTIDYVRENFTTPPQGVGRDTKLTLMTVDQVIGGMSDEDVKIMVLNEGWMEFAVAGIIFWKHAVNPIVKQHCEKIGLFETRLSDMKEIWGKYLDDTRRVAGVSSKYTKEENLVIAASLRKVVNLAGRDLKDADFEQEKQRTDPRYNVKFAPVPGKKTMAAQIWYDMVIAEMNDVIDKIFVNVMEQANMRPIDKWWMQRRVWVPSGSSSNRHNLDEYIKMDERIATQDRPNKRTIAETYSYSDFKNWLVMQPRGFARVSTKPEPGFKRRALYAQDDEGTFVASYASADIEKVMNIGGMVAKQTPKDVIEWMNAASKQAGGIGRMWVSLDYSDFNKEHSKILLYMLNVRLAAKWASMRHERSNDIMAQKAYCALWVARSHLNGMVRYPGEEYSRDYSGLWSGHRDTARDNTILHLVYSNVIRKIVKMNAKKTVGMHYIGICGDDEDAVHETEETAALYLGAHAVVGHAINPAKQLVDYEVHEFLQRYAAGNVLPIRPLAPMVATISTGSWYKMSYNYYDTILVSMNANFMEMVNRGANKKLVVKLAIVMLNRMMRARMPGREGDEEVIELEWWSYRAADKNGKLLWAESMENAKDGTDELEIKTNRVTPKSEAPAKAAEEWLQVNKKWIKLLTPEKIGAYKKDMLQEAYKSVFGKESQTMRDINAIEQFGLRKKKSIEAAKENFDKEAIAMKSMLDKLETKEVIREVKKNYGMRRPTTLESILARMQLDPVLFQMIGGWAGVRKAGGPAAFQHYTNTDIKIRRKQFNWLNMVDPAVASWMQNRWEE
jgi:hypothetical protein